MSTDDKKWPSLEELSKLAAEETRKALERQKTEEAGKEDQELLGEKLPEEQQTSGGWELTPSETKKERP